MTATPKTNASERLDGPLAPAGRPARRGGGSIAAIHALKSRLQLTDEDYRALLKGLVFKSSSKDMSEAERRQVRDHLQKLAERMGVARPRASQADFQARKAQLSPRERKVWALWNQLHRDGLIRNHSAPALGAWVKRQVGVDALRFCNGVQLDTLIEALKRWEGRAP